MNLCVYFHGESNGSKPKIIFFDKELNGKTTYNGSDLFFLEIIKKTSSIFQGGCLINEYTFRTSEGYLILDEPFCDKGKDCSKRGFLGHYSSTNGFTLSISNDDNALALTFALETLTVDNITINCYVTILDGIKYTLMFHEKIKKLVVKQIPRNYTYDDIKYSKIGFVTYDYGTFNFLSKTNMEEFRNLIFINPNDGSFAYNNYGINKQVV